jgi:hypothetical protein
VRVAVRAERVVDAVGHIEVLVGIPAHDLLGQPDLVFAERRAVCLGRVLLVGRWVPDDRLDADQARALVLLLAGLDCRLQRDDVVGVVDGAHVPAIGLEALAGVLGLEAQLSRAVERDVVVVVEVDEPAEAQVSRQ